MAGVVAGETCCKPWRGSCCCCSKQQACKAEAALGALRRLQAQPTEAVGQRASACKDCTAGLCCLEPAGFANVRVQGAAHCQSMQGRPRWQGRN